MLFKWLPKKRGKFAKHISNAQSEGFNKYKQAQYQAKWSMYKPVKTSIWLDKRLMYTSVKTTNWLDKKLMYTSVKTTIWLDRSLMYISVKTTIWPQAYFVVSEDFVV